MQNKEVYNRIFTEVLGVRIDAGTDLDKLLQAEIISWDSLAHMSLITAIEKEFSIRMTVAEIKKITSYKAGIEILRNYDIDM